MATWFKHLHTSPYCLKNCYVSVDAHGRDVCECGWADSEPRRGPPKPKPTTSPYR